MKSAFLLWANLFCQSPIRVHSRVQHCPQLLTCIKCILSTSTAGAAELKFGGLLHSTGETTAVVPMIWLSPGTEFYFPVRISADCRRQQSAEHLQSGCRGVKFSSPAFAEVPPGKGLQGWPWVKPNHVSIPWSSLSPSHAKTDCALQGPSDSFALLRPSGDAGCLTAFL